MKTDLPQEAQNVDCNGCGVSFEIITGDDGRRKARNITNNDGNFGNNDTFQMQKTSGGGNVDAVPSGEHSSGIIKSYNSTKGFGFITAEGLPGDVFFMRTDLPAEAQNADINGCGVTFEIMYAPDGK